MKRKSSILLLGLVLLFGLGGSALAASPYAPGNAGSFFAFGEYSPYMQWDENNSYPAAGVGYALTDSLALGVQGRLADGGLVPGAFVTAAFGPLAAGAEYWSKDGNYCLKATGLFNLSLGPVKLGVGGGMLHADEGDAKFVEVAGKTGFGKLGVYGAYDYYIDGPESQVLKAGVTYAF